MKNLKSKTGVLIICIIAAVVSLLGIGTTISYLHAHDTKTNTFKPGENKTEITEDWHKPKILTQKNVYLKTISVQNDSKVPCYVRVYIAFNNADALKYSYFSNATMTEEKEQEYTISIIQILKILRKYLIPILIITIAAGAVTYVNSAKFIKPKYKAEALIYVSAKDYMQSGTMTTSDLSIAKQLVNTYSIILKTDGVLNKVTERLGNQITAAKIKANLSASAVNNTEVFTISYVDTNPERAQAVVNAIADIAPDEIMNVVKAGNASVIQRQEKTPVNPISPNKTRNAAIAALAAFVLSAAVFILISLFDTRIRTVEDLTDEFDMPVLGSIPTITADLSAAETAEDDDDE